MSGLRRIPVTRIRAVLRLRGVPRDEWDDLQRIIERVDRAYTLEANRPPDEPEPVKGTGAS